MSLKLTAGVSKKLGLPGYSSVGAICHVELELDSGLLQEAPEAFRPGPRGLRPVRRVSRRRAGPSPGHWQPSGAGRRNARREICRGRRFRPCQRQRPRQRLPPPVEPHPRQGALPPVGPPDGIWQSLASRLGLDGEQLDGLCQRLFEKPLEGLSGGEASGLIRGFAGNARRLVGAGRRLSPGRRVTRIWGLANPRHGPPTGQLSCQR